MAGERGPGAEGIADDLRNRIHAGEWAPGELIPTQREIKATYGGSEGTIVRAIQILALEGLVQTDPDRPRLGARVTQRNPVRRDLVHGVRAEWQRARDGQTGDDGLFELSTGRDTGGPVVSYDWMPAPATIADVLEIERGTTMLRRSYHWWVEGTPHQWAVSWMTAEVADRCRLVSPDREVKGRGTMSQLADGGFLVDEPVQIEIEARMPTQEETRRLRLRAGTPVIVRRRTLRSGGRPVETSAGVVPGDQIVYTLAVDLEGAP